MEKLYRSLIYLLYCSANKVIPKKDVIQTVDLKMLYDVAKKHSVCAAIGFALEDAGVNDGKFFQAMKKAIRNNMLFDYERKSILSEFEKQGIWYMPLKGALLKEFYPKYGMREMADNDILYDKTKQHVVKKIMCEKGYYVEKTEKINIDHDVYYKPPTMNFELHPILFGDFHADKFRDYYSNPMRLMIKDTDNCFGYHFSDEDFYIYMTVHEFKHFSTYGTGIRSLLDCYIFLQNKGDSLDWQYIKTELNRLGINEYDNNRRELSMKLFSSDKIMSLTESEKDLLNKYLTAGTYGTYENQIKNKLNEESGVQLIMHSLFPNIKHMRQSVKFVDLCPILYPVGIVYRWGRVLFKRKLYLATIINVLKNDK